VKLSTDIRSCGVPCLHGEKSFNELPSLPTIDAVEICMICQVGYRTRIGSFRKFIGTLARPDSGFYDNPLHPATVTNFYCEEKSFITLNLHTVTLMLRVVTSGLKPRAKHTERQTRERDQSFS
jgi:hypothetical protein